jgi:hypothetical protein
MTPAIKTARPVPQSTSDGAQLWHVNYEFCEISATITVYAKDEAEARAKAANDLRMRGLKMG